ncbi:MAG: ASCH domain-containing protein [Nanoarchaeota archaeon]|nr:ASCH domain-containing protein [Nanoarchaeota archaeon]
MTRVLHLTLKKKWFDKIVSGEKKKEYRDIKPYWNIRLNKEYDEIHFKNGYNKDCPFMRIEFKGLEFDNLEGEKVYAIKLGKILEIKNHKTK